MSEENNKITEQNENIPNTAATNENTPNVEVETAVDTPKTDVPSKRQSEDDVSDVKIRKVLKQRFKKSNFGVKSVIVLILVAIIFFAAGVCADRVFLRHRAFNGFMGRPGIMRRLPNNNFNGRQFNNGNGKLPGKGSRNNKVPGNNAPSNNTPSNNSNGNKTQ